MTWLRVDYDHDSRDLGRVWIAPVDQGPPPEDGWHPAYRDTLPSGDRVVMVRSNAQVSRVWLADRDGVRRVRVRSDR